MEICQHCKMYMKPIIRQVSPTHLSAECEFCGEVIADGEVGGKWVKVEPSLSHP
jgi:hypothetical protein